MLRCSSPRQVQEGAATLLVALVLMMALTVVTLSVAHTQLVEQRIANNHHWHSRLLLLSEAGLAEGSQLLGSAPRSLHWNPRPGGNSEISQVTVDKPAPGIDTQLVLARRGPSTAFVSLQATSGSDDGSGLQAHTSQIVRPLSILSPLAESAPPLVINGCPGPPTAALDIRPRNWDLDQAGDAVWLNSALHCPAMPGIDTHRGTVKEQPLGTDLWSVMFSVDRDTFAAMAAEHAVLPAHESIYRMAETQDLVAGRWTRSEGSPEHPVALYFPADTGCPEFAPGVRIYGVVFIDADCSDALAPQGFEFYGSLMINGNLDASGARTQLNHIQVSDAVQTRLRFPVLRSVPVPGSWRDF